MLDYTLSRNVIKEIDGVEFTTDKMIISKYTGDRVDLSNLSTGCKTLLNIMHNTDKIFTIQECGCNVLKLIYALKNGMVYSDAIVTPMDENIINDIYLISDDSGTGKSFLWKILDEESSLDTRIITINYKDINRKIENMIMNEKGKVFIIDNGDIVLEDTLRKYIGFDVNNQYIIIGRNPGGLFLSQKNIKRLNLKDKCLGLTDW